MLFSGPAGETNGSSREESGSARGRGAFTTCSIFFYKRLISRFLPSFAVSDVKNTIFSFLFVGSDSKN